MTTTERHVAFLRAINVGGHRVTMARLRQLIEELGFVDVETWLASGNVVFSGALADRRAVETAIAEHLERALGFPVETFVRTVGEVVDLAQPCAHPFDDAADAPSIKRYVSFLHEPLDAAQRVKLPELSDAVYELRDQGTEVHWLRRMGRGDSRLTNAAVERALGVPATRRNVNTVQRLAKKLASR